MDAPRILKDPIFVEIVIYFDKTSTLKHPYGLHIERIDPGVDLRSVLCFCKLDQCVDHSSTDMSVLIRLSNDDIDFPIVLQTHIATQSIVVFDIEQIAMMIQIAVHSFQSIQIVGFLSIIHLFA